MNTFVVALTASVLSLGSGQPIFEDLPSFQKTVAETHFGKLDDFKDVDILPKKDPSIPNTEQFELKNDGSGNYHFSFNAHGFQRTEVGELKNAGTDKEIQVVRGQYTDRLFDPLTGSSVIRTIGYMADENGYRPFLIKFDIERPGFSVGSAGVEVVGAPKGDKEAIGGAVHASLVGGNTIG